MIGLGHAQGELLAQVRPGVVTAIELLAASTLRQEVTLIMIDNHGTGNVQLKVYHDDAGSSYTDATGIIHKSISQNTDPVLFQAQHPGSGIHVKPGGTLGVLVDSANDVTLSLYGISETLAERTIGAR